MGAEQEAGRRHRRRTTAALAALTIAGVLVGLALGLAALALDPTGSSLQAPAHLQRVGGGFLAGPTKSNTIPPSAGTH